MTNRDKIPIRLDVGQSAFNMSTLTEDQTGTFKPEVTPSVTLIPTATSDINVRISDADGAESLVVSQLRFLPFTFATSQLDGRLSFYLAIFSRSIDSPVGLRYWMVLASLSALSLATTTL